MRQAEVQAGPPHIGSSGEREAKRLPEQGLSAAFLQSPNR